MSQDKSTVMDKLMRNACETGHLFESDDYSFDGLGSLYK